MQTKEEYYAERIMKEHGKLTVKQAVEKIVGIVEECSKKRAN